MAGRKNKFTCKDCGILKTDDNTYKVKSKSGDKVYCGFTSRCKTCHKAHMKRHRGTEAQFKYRQEYNKQNTDRRRAINREYRKLKRKEKPFEFLLIERMQKRVNRALSPDCKKLDKPIETIGCTPRFLRQYLESKFQEGMNWDNRGRTGWHVDHMLPISAFDLTKPEQAQHCFHFSNLQPLWYTDNIHKRNTIPDKFKDIEAIQLLKNVG